MQLVVLRFLLRFALPSSKLFRFPLLEINLVLLLVDIEFNTLYINKLKFRFLALSKVINGTEVLLLECSIRVIRINILQLGGSIVARLIV